jgi:peptide/nickel transport system substrate-binding protein
LLILLVVVMVVSLTVSCGQKAPTTPVEQPKPQKPLVWGGPDIETLNPILSESSYETDIMNAVFSTLIKVNEKLEYVPDLLEELPKVSPDGLTYTFKLRKGVKFHDGVELTTKDVKYTYDLKMDSNIAVPSRTLMEKIDTWNIVDDYNFSFTLKEYVAEYLEGWAYSEAIIVPKHIVEAEYKASGNSLTKGGDFSRKPIGSGPYKLVDWKPTEYIMLERFDDYFKGKPQIEKVVFKFIPTDDVKLAQFTAGDIDIMEVPAPQYREVLSLKDKGMPINVSNYPAFIYVHADFNLRNPVFQDKEVRQALAYAWPQDDFIETVLDGVGQPASGFLPTISWAYNPNVKKYNYDLKKAEELLESAGWKLGADGIRAKDGLKLQFTMNTSAGNKVRESWQQIVQQEWAKIGVKADIQNYEPATLFGDILDGIKFDMIIFGWVSGFDPSPRTLWHSEQIPDPTNPEATGQNYPGFVNGRVDELIDLGEKEMNREKRKEYYFEIQEILAEEVPSIYIYFFAKVYAYPSNLKNFKENPTQANNTWNIWEWELQ